jgi:hypothetical protein
MIRDREKFSKFLSNKREKFLSLVGEKT